MQFEESFLRILVVIVTLYVLNKIRVRLLLSRAKYRSISGHSKWSRRLAKFMPYFEYDEKEFFASDGAPAAISKRRKQAFTKLCEEFSDKFEQSIVMNDQLANGISDVNFINAYRVPFPYRDYLQKHLKLGNIVDQSKGVKVKDIDGNWSIDLTGSYGVNLFGYDFYKDCMQKGFDRVKDLGPVLGSYHPIIADNVERLKDISQLDEISFHMSGTEAVMQAVRLARYHTGRSHLVRFCGAYHGWWDGVQPGIGNQRRTNDVYTLSDMSNITLKVLQTRQDIACVLVNPLQALHPNKDAASDAALINSSRKADFNKKSYSEWLKKLQTVCNEKGIVLILDEIFTGFRLAYRGAAEYFDVQPDMITYGKTLGGGLPVGIVCGKKALMKRYKDKHPANISFARGTFNSHPLVLASMNEFLKKLDEPEIQAIYQSSEKIWNERIHQLNLKLEQQNLPIKVKHLLSICMITFDLPSRYNWMFQFYLKQENLLLSWVGSGRLIMSHNFTDTDFQNVVQAIISAAKKMKQDGWWWQDEKLTNRSIQKQMLRSIVKAKISA